MESDHKPLEVIVKKPLHLAPKRLQRMLLRVQAYSINLGYRKGSTMYLADALSRAYLPYDGSQTIASEVESINMTQDACLKPSTLQEIKQHTAKDDSLQELIKIIKAGWPETKGELSHLVLPYFGIRDELSVDDDVVVRGERLVIPKSLRQDLIRRLHYAHSGVVSTLSRARGCIYWPGMSSEIKQFIETCDVCRAYDKRQPKETLISHEVTGRPWANVGVDLFSYESRNYLICVDYYSSFWEIDLLEDTRSATVIRKLKAQFARHGIPETCVSDNGSQFISDEFKKFSRHWSFAHVTSSLAYPQSNGKVEAAVKSAKSVMKKSTKAKTDPYLALLEYRNTPSQGMESSPVVRLMNRRTRTQVPTLPRLLMMSTIRC